MHRAKCSTQRLRNRTHVVSFRNALLCKGSKGICTTRGSLGEVTKLIPDLVIRHGIDSSSVAINNVL